MVNRTTNLAHSLSAEAAREMKPSSFEAPRQFTDFGFRLVALSGRTGLNGLVHNAEVLSPLLSGLDSSESLAVEIVLDAPNSGAVVRVRGRVHSDGAVDERRDRLGQLLHALGKTQFPGFILRPLDKHEALQAALIERAVLNPCGRPIASVRKQKAQPGPAIVAQSNMEMQLPSMRLSPQGLVAALELLRARAEPAVLSLEMRLVQFDAAALRVLSVARDAAAGSEPHSQVEVLRHLAETIPDDALMSTLINDGSGVELTLVVYSGKPLDEADGRMLCHAIFGVEPAHNEPSVTLDLRATYPCNFALGQVVGGLAAAAVTTLRRTPADYEPPTQSGVQLGMTLDGRPVVITDNDRKLHQVVLGSTGTGKSNLLLNQMAADIKVGKGMLLLDPHGDLWEAVRSLVPQHRQKDLILAQLGNPQFNFTMNVLAGLGGDPAIERSATVNGLVRLFKNSLWPGVQEAFGPMWEAYFRNSMLLLMEAEGDQATILDFERVFQDEKYRNHLVSLCKTRTVVDFWQKVAERVGFGHDISLENITPYIVCKFSPFTTNRLLAPILGSPTTSLDLKNAIEDGKVVLVNLAKGIVGEGSARLVGGLITMRLVAAAQSQMMLPESERKEFVAYLDEFQTYATEHITEGIEETRKYKLRLVLACQSLGQIDGKSNRPDVAASILANVANLISFRLGVDDAHTLSRWFEPMFRAEDLMYLPNYTAVGRLLVNGEALRPIEFRTLPPPKGDA